MSPQDKKRLMAAARLLALTAGHKVHGEKDTTGEALRANPFDALSPLWQSFRDGILISVSQTRNASQ